MQSLLFLVISSVHAVCDISDGSSCCGSVGQVPIDTLEHCEALKAAGECHSSSCSFPFTIAGDQPSIASSMKTYWCCRNPEGYKNFVPPHPMLPSRQLVAESEQQPVANAVEKP